MLSWFSRRVVVWMVSSGAWPTLAYTVLGAAGAIVGCVDRTTSERDADSGPAAASLRDGASSPSERTEPDELDAAVSSTPETVTQSDASVSSVAREGGPVPGEPDTGVITATSSGESELPVEAGVDDIDPSEVDCPLGGVGCAEGIAYECGGDYDDPAWSPRSDVQCPLWSEEACREAVNALRAEPQPCNTDADCEVWGGMNSDYACAGSFSDPVFSISSLASEIQRQKWGEAFRALVAGGCQDEWDPDGAPPDAECVGGQCSSTDYSCLDDWGEQFEAGAGSTLDAGREAGTAPQVRDGGRDSGMNLIEASSPETNLDP